LQLAFLQVADEAAPQRPALAHWPSMAYAAYDTDLRLAVVVEAPKLQKGTGLKKVGGVEADAPSGDILRPGVHWRRAGQHRSAGAGQRGREARRLATVGLLRGDSWPARRQALPQHDQPLRHRINLIAGHKKGTGTFYRNGPKGAAH